jgi:hypothetical protein
MSFVSQPTGTGSSAPVPALTVAQATNASDTTQGTVSGQVLAALIATKSLGDISTAKVLAVTSVGQTAFTLPSVPTQPSGAVLFINSTEYANPSAFIISGTTLTWTGGFNLSPTDDVRVSYV